MASIITATNSSGLTTSADNSGVLQLASGTGNLVTIPSVTGTAMVSGNMPAFSAYAPSTQNLSNNAFTKIIYSTEDFDTANCYDSTTNYRFTPNVAGYYQANAGIYVDGSFSNLQLSIYKNGAEYIRFFQTASSQRQVSGCGLVYMNGSTDYIEVYAYQGTGGTLVAGGYSFMKFQAILVRTA